MHVGIVGAGWAGLACAVQLARAGIPFTLFEAGRQAGGRARSVGLDGQVLDNGQHLLLGAYRTLLQLMRQVDVEPDTVLWRVPFDLQAVQAASGREAFRLALPRWPAPLHVLAGLLRARGLSGGEKFALLRAMAGLQWQGYRLPADCSVQDWLRQTCQPEILCQQLWAPLCLAALNTPVQHASAQIFAHVLRDSLGNWQRGATDFLLPRLPLGEIFPQPALVWLQRQPGVTIRLSHRVKTITWTGQSAEAATNGAWQLAGLCGHQPFRETFSHVVLATAPQHLSALLAGLTGDLPPATGRPLMQCQHVLAAYQYEPIATVYLDYARPLPLPAPLLHLNIGMGQWLVHRGAIEPPAGHSGQPGQVACVQSGRGDWMRLDNAGLCEHLHQAIAQACRQPDLPRPHGQRVIREQRATFSCRPDLPRLPMQPLPGVPGLLLAGDHVWADYPATLEGAVRSGCQAAAVLSGQPVAA